MVRKSHIHVTKTGSLQTSSCPLIIEGIIPQQQVDLCTGHCTNLTLVHIDSNNGLVPAAGELSVYVL